MKQHNLFRVIANFRHVGTPQHSARALGGPVRVCYTTRAELTISGEGLTMEQALAEARYVLPGWEIFEVKHAGIGEVHE